ncbi:MAG: ABC transporter substrate-binding protein [Methanoregula sp.]|nr:ABC transporter substrate-binding protein [Methanoregula sp.]
MKENTDDPVYIVPNHSIRSVLSRYPELEQLFESYSLAELRDAPSRSEKAVYLTLEDALRDKNIDCAGFIALAKEHAAAYRTPENRSLAARSYNQRDLQFLGLMPCPVKIPFDSAFTQFVSREWGGKPPFSYLIESNANNQLAYYTHIPKFKDLIDMPDIVISPGLNGYYHRDFFERFKNKGYFSDVIEHASPTYDRLDLADPDGHYSVIGANIEVMVVDNTRIGDRQIPERWTDLLHPEFTGSVAIRGQDGFFCETVLLTLYKEMGLEGIRMLARSISSAVHPAQMVKNAGSKAGGPAISIMPFFFANLAKNTRNVTIVWPEEGAIVSPVTMIVKRDHSTDLDLLIKFLAGKETGSLLSGVHFPSMVPDVPPCVPRDTAFSWIGWDYIRGHDIGKETEMVSREFAAVFSGNYS